MLHDVEVEPIETEAAPELEIDPPQPTKAASLTGALVQRGRDRAGRVPEPVFAVQPEPSAARFAAPPPAPEPEAAPEPAAEAAFAPVLDEVPLVFARPPRAAAATASEAKSSRWSDALFVAACCAAFFATFLFALRF